MSTPLLSDSNPGLDSDWLARLHVGAKSNLWKSKTLVVLLGLVLVAIVGWIDYVSGTELSVSVFYVFPILFVTWYAGVWYGVLLSLVSAITWLILLLLGGFSVSHVLIHYWNGATRLGFFLISVFLLARLKI